MHASSSAALSSAVPSSAAGCDRADGHAHGVAGECGEGVGFGRWSSDKNFSMAATAAQASFPFLPDRASALVMVRVHQVAWPQFLFGLLER